MGYWNGITKKAMARAIAATLLGALALSGQQEDHGSFQILHSFTGPDGANPFGGLTPGKNGVLYGTTEYGGVTPTCTGCGSVFQLTPPAVPGGDWQESVIYSFPSYSLPLSTLAVGPGGELYGTTYFGGIGVGEVFELTPPSVPGGTWTETTLYSFSDGYQDPQNPEAGVILGQNGVLYGTVQFGGLSPNCPESYSSLYGCGAVYSLTPPATAGGAWTEQTLHFFTGGSDGGVALTGLVFGKSGELYGATFYGGPSSTCSSYGSVVGCGTVYRLDPPASQGGAWTETVLYSFTGGADGGYPNSVIYQAGALYGTVTFGGNLKHCGGFGCGGVFRLSPPAASGGPWTERVLYSFTGVPDGLYPAAGPVFGKDGKLYGTTRDGGLASECPESPGCGVVFELTPPRDRGDGWEERVLHRFKAAEGSRPTASLLAGPGGELFGTVWVGGTATTCGDGCGAVFAIQPSDSDEKENRD